MLRQFRCTFPARSDESLASFEAALLAQREAVNVPRDLPIDVAALRAADTAQEYLVDIDTDDGVQRFAVFQLYGLQAVRVDQLVKNVAAEARKKCATIDDAVATFTTWTTLEEALYDGVRCAAYLYVYRPTVRADLDRRLVHFADAYDKIMQELGDERRAYRFPR